VALQLPGFSEAQLHEGSVRVPIGTHVAALKPRVERKAGVSGRFTVVALCRRSGQYVDRAEYGRAFGPESLERLCHHCLLLVDEYETRAAEAIEVFTRDTLMWHQGGANIAAKDQRKWRPRRTRLWPRDEELTAKRRAA
jgi:hypothetical protein